VICSNCSAEVRPVVALDIDGTLGDYHGHFTRFACDYLQEPYPFAIYDGSEPHRVWAMRMFNIDVRTFRDIKLAYRQGAQKRSMPVYPGAAELVEGLHHAGAEVWLTTTRPYLRLDNIDPDTRFWLARNDIEMYDGLLYHEDKYDWLVENIDPRRVVAILDDLPEQYDAAQDAFGAAIPIQRRTQYNRGALRGTQVGTLETALTMIAGRIQTWRQWIADGKLN
jgi:hypothetical protein